MRWRISDRRTGALSDPGTHSDSTGACCENASNGQPCASQPGWRVTRVRIVVTDPATGAEIDEPPSGLDARCSARELTTPFTLPLGLYAITLRAFDPAAPDLVEAESPSPELRTVRQAEIVNLDVVALSVTSP